MTWYDMIRWCHLTILSLFFESIDLCLKWDNISVEGTTQLRSHCSFYGSPPQLSWHLSSMTHTLLFSISVESMHCMSQNSWVFQTHSIVLQFQFPLLFCYHYIFFPHYCSLFQISWVILTHPIVLMSNYFFFIVPHSKFPQSYWFTPLFPYFDHSYCSFCHCSPLQFEIIKNLYKPPHFPPLQAERLLPQPPPSPPQLFYRYYSV